MHIVRKIKKYSPIRVANAMGYLGYYWKNPNRTPTNIDIMVMGVPKTDLIQILKYLETK